jgi:hypothetical protein
MVHGLLRSWENLVLQHAVLQLLLQLEEVQHHGLVANQHQLLEVDLHPNLLLGVLQHNSLDIGQTHSNQEDLQCKVGVHQQEWLAFVVLVTSKLKDVVLFKAEAVQVDQQDLEQLKEQSL